MIGAGTTATVIDWNVRVNYSSTPPTGGWDYDDGTSYGSRVNSYSVPSTPEPPNPRKDPKNWALWFREFLSLIFPRVRFEVTTLATPLRPRLAFHCRSGPHRVREWKMKNWVQALKSQQI